MKLTPEQLTEKLRKAHGENLKSVVLYGSSVTGDYAKKFSDFNVLVVLQEASLAELRNAGSTVQAWVAAGNPPPLIFTLERLKRSADVFPLEISDIKEFHRVLHGEDPLGEVEVHMENFRLELEHELKGKLIQLRESYLLSGGKEKQVRELLARSASTFLLLFRHTARLLGIEPLPAKRDAARVLGGRLSFDASVFDEIVSLRESGKLPAGSTADSVMGRYLPAVEAVVDAVDSFVHGKT
jgi:predicted nucleotidyltransferase